jgi:hypothetical protein
MDCPYSGSDRRVIPHRLDAVGVRSLTYQNMSIHQESALSMMLSLRVTLGVCLLMVARSPTGFTVST